MTKEEKIKEAWGVILETLTDKKDIDYIISNDGYFIDEKFMHTTETVVFWCGVELTKHPFDNHKYRPKSLQGIENNGWIKIESEEYLPKIGEYDMSSFTLYYWTNNGLYQSEDYKRWKLYYDNFQITHYRLEPIFKPKPPIYQI